MPARQSGWSFFRRVASCRSMNVTAPASAAPGSWSGGTIWSQAAARVFASSSVSVRQRLVGFAAGHGGGGGGDGARLQEPASIDGIGIVHRSPPEPRHHTGRIAPRQ